MKKGYFFLHPIISFFNLAVTPLASPYTGSSAPPLNVSPNYLQIDSFLNKNFDQKEQENIKSKVHESS